MSFKCDKCEKKFETINEAEKHEESCRGRKKLNHIEKAKNMLEKDEKILEQIIVQRILKRFSTFIFLTNKSIIYWQYGFMSIKFRKISLSEIEDIMYLPKPLHSGGLIKAVTKKGKSILLTTSYVGQHEAYDFIKKVKLKLKR